MINRRNMIAGGTTAIAAALTRSKALAQSPAKLLFIHGRAQGGRLVSDIRREWTNALSKGAAASGGVLPSGLDVRLPFYGDELDRLTEEFNLPLADDVVTRGTADEVAFLEFQAEAAEDIRQRAGVTDAELDAAYGNNPRERGPQNWEWVQAIFRAIDSHNASATSDFLQLFLRDVYMYNVSQVVRQKVNDFVMAEIDDQPMVIVAHSLGTVIAFDILRGLAAPNIPLLVTLGSPLGIRAISRRYRPLRYPATVKSWVNAYDDRDVVALYPLDAENFAVTPAIENVGTLRNGTRNRHGISGYLDKPEVVGPILTAL